MSTTTTLSTADITMAITAVLATGYIYSYVYSFPTHMSTIYNKVIADQVAGGPSSMELLGHRTSDSQLAVVPEWYWPPERTSRELLCPMTSMYS